MSSLGELRYRFNSATAGAVDAGTVQLDAHTMRWAQGEAAAQSLSQALALTAISAVMPRDEAQARLDLPSVHLLR